MENTKIQWATSTFNPWIGCTKVSPGCAHCYAEHSTPTRTKGIKWGQGQPRSRTSASYWTQPLRWNYRAKTLSETLSETKPERPRIFPSLMDWLDDEVPIEWLADFLKLIHDTPHLDWLLLTKRPENFANRLKQCALKIPGYEGNTALFWWMRGQPPHNIWIGTSVEDQPRADQRIPALLKIPAAIRFLSVEPLLGPIDFGLYAHAKFGRLDEQFHEVEAPQKKLQWVIIGGESGRHARPCNIQWIRSLIAQCHSANVPPFVKQLGSNPFSTAGTSSEPLIHPLSHPKGGDPAEWPPDLRIRQFPERSAP